MLGSILTPVGRWCELPSRQQTLGEYMVSRVGLLKATKVAAFVYSWGIYIEQESGRPTMEAYTAYWKQSISSTYRERDLFRICWPGEKDPTALWLQIRALADSYITPDKHVPARRELGTVQILGLRVPGAF
jgi:hypothetical protein